jgi:hypothetical protein
MQIIKHVCPILQTNSNLRHLFKDDSLMALRRQAILKGMLVTAKISYSPEKKE